MYQWLLFSKVFLVFVFLDVLEVVNTAEAQDDEVPLKDSAFSEVIKNITRVNTVLQELIKNYEKLQKIYHSQESLEQQYSSQDENSYKYGNNLRSKYIPTPAKPKDFPATNIPFEDIDGSPEDVVTENKISTGKSPEGRPPHVEAQIHSNNKDKPKEKHEKVAATKGKDLKETVVETDSSSDMTQEKLGKQKKKPKVSNEINEHVVPKTTKESEKANAKHNIEQKGVTKKKVITEYGSMERPKRNSSNVNTNSTNNKIVMKSIYSPVRDETPDNDASYKQRKRLDDNKRVFDPFATEGRPEEKSAKSHSKKANLRFGSINKSTTKKKESHKKVKKDTQSREVSPDIMRMVTQLFSHRAANDQPEVPKQEDQKQEDHKQEVHKQEDHKQEVHKQEVHKKIQQKDEDKELDIVASSEDEKSIKKEQFKTSILRKAYGDACLKVVVKKCYKACKGTLKRGCKVFNCKSNFQLQFKEHAKTGCIVQFRDNNTVKPHVVETQISGRVYPLKEGKEMKEVPTARAKDADEDFDGFSDLTRDGYLAAACLPKTRRTEVAQSSSDKQLNILRDRFERECQKVSCSKCNKACAYTVDKTCATFNCYDDKRKLLYKYCKQECRDSYRSKPKSKNKSSRSDDSSDSRSRSDSDDSGSDSDTDISDTDSSETQPTKTQPTKTTPQIENVPPTNATIKDETKRKLRAGHTHKDKDRDATNINERAPKTVEEEKFYRALDTKAWKHTEPTKKYEPVKFKSQEVWKHDLESKKTQVEKLKQRAEDMSKSLTRLRAVTTSHEVWKYEPETQRTVKVRVGETKDSATPVYRRADYLKS